MLGGIWLDEYERTARLLPGLLLVAPVLAVIAGFGLSVAALGTAGVLGVLALAGPTVLANHVRSRGRAVQQRLFAIWGGSPTTQLLRTSLTGVDGAILAQRRANVERVTGRTLPAAGHLSLQDSEEFDAAVSVLRNKTYDHQRFPLVFAENKSYGFERNLRGVRREGRGASLVGLLVLLGALIVDHEAITALNPTNLLISSALLMGLFAFWVFWPTDERVRDAGLRYAERLLDAANNI